MKIKKFYQALTLFSALTLFIFFSYSGYCQTNVVTQHYDLNRTGWNKNETILNTKNVRAGSFGKLYTRAVDDQIYAQLLVVRNVNIPGHGVKNIVIAATVNNSVYAFDADSSSVSSPYWHVNLTPPGQRPPRNTDMTGACGGHYNDFTGNIGIVGTPVIDTTTNIIYVVARSCNPDTTGFVQYLHALDITTGNEKVNSPKLITAQIPGTGYGNSHGVITFDAKRQNQRCGLLLLNGIIYIAYASHCDWEPYFGWIFGYDKTSLQQTSFFIDTRQGQNGGIWMSGAAPAADALGNIYVASGNGTAGLNGNIADTANRAESAIKLTPNGSKLTISSFFTPSNYTTLNSGDLDFGSSEMMLIPNTNQVMTGVKDGNIYIMNRDNLGGYNSGSNNVVQTINLGTNAHLRCSFSYYKGSQKEFIYTWSENSLLKAFPYDRTSDTLNVKNAISSGVQGPIGNCGAFMSLSSNNSVDSTAVLWTSFAKSSDANQSVSPGILYAFDATDVTKKLWSSGDDPVDNPGNFAKFNCPTIANGKVYLATFSNQFVVYGLTGNVADTCNSTNIALNKPAFASSSGNSTNTPDKAFDGNTSTGWASSQGSDPQYIYVDLGKQYDLCSVLLTWEKSLGKNFTIDVSNDAVNWSTLATKTNNLSYTNYIPLHGSGRYVRMYGTARGTNFGYSLYEFEVYGTPSAGDCPLPTGFSTSDIYANTATIHWNVSAQSSFKVQYKFVAASDWTTITADTNMVTIKNLACGTDYLYRVQSFCSATDSSDYSPSSPFSTLSCAGGCNPLPTRWTTQDVGNTSIVGSACYNNATFTLNGSGNDIGGVADAFRFAYKTLVGDGEFNARVATLDQANGFNKYGIMIRETLSPGSKYAFIALTSGNGAAFQTRSVTDGATESSNSSTNIVAPYWIKLIKTGSVYSALISPDGINYTVVGNQVNVGFGGSDPVYAGLAISSHDNTKLSTGTIDNYEFTSGILPLKLLTFNASLNFENKVVLKWLTTGEMNTKSFVIERSTSDYNFTALDTVAALNNGPFTTTYNAIDRFPSNGINFYRLKIIDNDGHVSYSALVLVRLNNATSPLIYPNPAHTYINIVKGSELVQYINIYSITGKLIMSMSNTSNNNSIQISTSNFMKGSYIVEITTPTNVYRDKVIIN